MINISLIRVHCIVEFIVHSRFKTTLAILCLSLSSNSLRFSLSSNSADPNFVPTHTDFTVGTPQSPQNPHSSHLP